MQSSESVAGAAGGADTAVATAVAVKLPLFEGPLDLLLHLIRINEVDVTDIPIAQIAAQYVETLELMQELDLDVAGEYLVMAATLGWIKSRLLLPSIEAEDDEEVDPRAELMQRLLDYQRFKEASEELGERHREGRDVFRATAGEIEPTPEGEREVAVGLVDLLEAYRRVVRGKPKRVRGVHEVEGETITVHERMMAVMECLDDAEQVEFQQIFEIGDQTREPSRALFVTTFLAILELMRLMALRAYQGLDEEGVPEGPIRLRRHTGEDGLHWRDRIAEIM